jgi:hypothetical protein
MPRVGSIPTSSAKYINMHHVKEIYNKELVKYLESNDIKYSKIEAEKSLIIELDLSIVNKDHWIKIKNILNEKDKSQV